MGECAMKCRAYAKALHYKEEEFHSGPTAATLEALIRYVVHPVVWAGGTGHVDMIMYFPGLSVCGMLWATYQDDWYVVDH